MVKFSFGFISSHKIQNKCQRIIYGFLGVYDTRGWLSSKLLSFEIYLDCKIKPGSFVSSCFSVFNTWLFSLFFNYSNIFIKYC